MQQIGNGAPDCDWIKVEKAGQGFMSGHTTGPFTAFRIAWTNHRGIADSMELTMDGYDERLVQFVSDNFGKPGASGSVRGQTTYLWYRNPEKSRLSVYA